MLKNKTSTKGYGQKWGQQGRSGVALKIVAGRTFVSKDAKEVPGTQMLTDQIKGSTDTNQRENLPTAGVIWGA